MIEHMDWICRRDAYISMSSHLCHLWWLQAFEKQEAEYENAKEQAAKLEEQLAAAQKEVADTTSTLATVRARKSYPCFHALLLLRIELRRQLSLLLLGYILQAVCQLAHVRQEKCGVLWLLQGPHSF